MAYKFQLGAFTASGSIKAEEGFDAGDANITNVADIALDTISADQGSSVQFTDNALMNTNKEIQFRAGEQQILSDAVDSLKLKASASLGMDVNGQSVFSLSAQGAMFSKDVQMSGSTKIAYGENMESGKFLVSNGNEFASVAASGDATLASNGALTIADNAVTLAKMAGLASGKLILGDSNGDPAAATMSGDATLSNTGALTIADNAVTLAKMAGIAQGSIIHGDSNGDPVALAKGAENTVLTSDGTDISYAAVSNAMLTNSAVTVTAGDGLQGGGSVSLGGSVTLNIDVDVMAGVGLTADNSNEELDVSAAQTGIESIYNAALIVGRGASDAHIDFGTDNQIQFDIDNTATMNLSAGGLSIEQGGIQVPAGADVDVAGAGASSLFASAGANNLTIGGASSTVVIPGNLTVTGTTVEINAAFVVTSSVQFEGITPDGNEITLTSADPTAARTITLPDLSGHVPLIAGAATAASIAVTAAEFALLDGASADSSVTIVDADQMIINDGGVMKQTAMSDIKTYVAGASTLAVAAKVDGNALDEDKVNFFADLSADATVTLPASAAGLIGKSVYIKAKDLTSGATIIINSQASGQKIDGQDSIVLESPYASVRLVYVATDDWRVF